MPPKKTKEKASKEMVEVAPPPPPVVTIPPLVEDCKGVTTSPDPICAAAVAANKLCLGHHNGIVTLHDISGVTSADVVEVAAHRGAIRAMIVITTGPSAGEILLTASADGTIKAHAIPSGQWTMTFSGHEGPVESIAVSPAGDRLFSGGSDGNLAEWNIKTGQLLQSLKCHVGRVTGLCVPLVPLPPAADDAVPVVTEIEPPPSGTIITVSDDTLAKLIHPASRSIRAIMKGESPICSVAYAHPTIFVGCTDGKIRGFNIHSAQNSCIYHGHEDAVNSLCCVGGRLFSASDDTTVRMWSPGKWMTDHVFQGHVKSATCLALDLDHGRLFSGGFDGAGRAWDLAGALKWIETVEKAAADAAPKPAKKAAKKDASPKRR